MAGNYHEPYMLYEADDIKIWMPGEIDYFLYGSEKDYHKKLNDKWKEYIMTK